MNQERITGFENEISRFHYISLLFQCCGFQNSTNFVVRL